MSAQNLVTFEKQSFEEWPQEMTYDTLPLGVKVSSTTVTALDLLLNQDATSSVIGTVTVLSRSVSYVVKGGTDGDKYKISIRSVASNGAKLEDDVIMLIKDK